MPLSMPLSHAPIYASIHASANPCTQNPSPSTNPPHKASTHSSAQSYNYWETHAHDHTHGGWDESKDVPKLKSDEARTVKGVDTHLHVMDALLRINQALEDPLVPRRLRELYEV